MTRSERNWWIRFTLLAGACAALAIGCALQGDQANPPVWMCNQNPKAYEGRSIWIPGAVVTDRRGGVVTLRVGVQMVQGTGKILDLRLNDKVWISGTFHAPNEIRIDATRRLESHGERPVIILISGIVLILIGLNLLRQFRFSHPRRALIERGR